MSDMVEDAPDTRKGKFLRCGEDAPASCGGRLSDMVTDAPETREKQFVGCGEDPQ